METDKQLRKSLCVHFQNGMLYLLDEFNLYASSKGNELVYT